MPMRERDAYVSFEPELRSKEHIDKDELKAHGHFFTLRYPILFHGGTPLPLRHGH